MAEDSNTNDNAADAPTAPEQERISELKREDLVRIIMPSVGDMQLVVQDGGVLLFRPVYFGGECAGPIVQRVSACSDGTEHVNASYRVKIRSNGELKLAKAD